jgi:putative phosphoribosyl transferase
VSRRDQDENHTPPAQTLDGIKAEADEVVCLQAPREFLAVGQFFENFSEVTDEMVVAALSRERSTEA